MDRLQAPASFQVIAKDELVKIVFDPVAGAEVQISLDRYERFATNGISNSV